MIAGIVLFGITCVYIESRVRRLESTVQEMFAQSIQAEWQMNGSTVRVVTFTNDGETDAETVQRHLEAVKELDDALTP